MKIEKIGKDEKLFIISLSLFALVNILSAVINLWKVVSQRELSVCLDAGVTMTPLFSLGMIIYVLALDPGRVVLIELRKVIAQARQRSTGRNETHTS